MKMSEHQITIEPSIAMQCLKSKDDRANMFKTKPIKREHNCHDFIIILHLIEMN